MKFYTDSFRLTYLMGVVNSIISMSKIEDANEDVVAIAKILEDALKIIED